MIQEYSTPQTLQAFHGTWLMPPLAASPALQYSF
jgi:hypothetical protein